MYFIFIKSDIIADSLLNKLIRNIVFRLCRKESFKKYYFYKKLPYQNIHHMKSLQSIIVSPSHHLDNSLDFYRRLNYKVFNQKDRTLVTDGKVVIELTTNHFHRAGIKLFKSDWSSELATLEQLTTVTKTDNTHILSDPNGVWIYLDTSTPPTIDMADDTENFGSTGQFAGMGIEATDMKKSIAIWEALGFEQGQGSIEQGWVTYSNGNSIDISLMRPLMCPHLFFNPSLTFFNSGKNERYIEKIRAANIPITEEITVFNKEGIVDNIIIRDPGGYGFFVFND